MSKRSPPTAQSRFLDEDKALACIHCGLCLPSCPTFLETGNENDSPRGRIYQMRAVHDGRLPLSKETVRHFDLCLGCRACEVACPSGVEYGSLLESTREHVERNFKRSLSETLLRRFLIDRILPYSRRVDFALLPARFVKWSGFDSLLPNSLRRFSDLVPDQIAARQPLPYFSPTTASTKLGRVGFISGCVMDVIFNQTNWNSIRLLNLAGYDVITPPNQSCCGALHAHSGKLDRARTLAKSLVDSFSEDDPNFIVTNAAGCGSTLKEYGMLFDTKAHESKLATRFASKVLDFSEALVRSRDFVDLLIEVKKKSSPEGRVIYQDACHLAHAQMVTEAPRRLLKAVASENFLELPESDVCCGSAGSYNLTEPEMANRLGIRKIVNIRKTQSPVVVSTNPGCILQIRSHLKQTHVEAVEAIHIADYLARVLDLPKE